MNPNKRVKKQLFTGSFRLEIPQKPGMITCPLNNTLCKHHSDSADVSYYLSYA